MQEVALVTCQSRDTGEFWSAITGNSPEVKVPLFGNRVVSLRVISGKGALAQSEGRVVKVPYF